MTSLEAYERVEALLEQIGEQIAEHEWSVRDLKAQQATLLRQLARLEAEVERDTRPAVST